MNRLHREMKIYFPEYKDAFGKIDGAFCMAVLKEAPFPEDILKLGGEGIQGDLAPGKAERTRLQQGG